MTVREWVREGLLDVEQRLLGITASPVDDDAQFWTVLEESVPGRIVSATFGACQRASAESRSVKTWTLVRMKAAKLGPLRWMRFVGVAALAAAVTHVALAEPGHPAGMWWMIVPVTVATFGACVTAFSWCGPKPQDDSR